MHGLGFVRGNLVRDVASLKKMELLPWDCLGVILHEQLDDPADLAALDEIAALTAGVVPDFAAVRKAYQGDTRLRVDGSIHSYVNGQLVSLNLA
jgi:hypothetical protein